MKKMYKEIAIVSVLLLVVFCVVMGVKVSVEFEKDAKNFKDLILCSIPLLYTCYSIIRTQQSKEI